MVSVLVRTLIGIRPGPHFDALQDFWGRRWNLVANNILRLTVFGPTHRLSLRVFGPSGPHLLPSLSPSSPPASFMSSFSTTWAELGPLGKSRASSSFTDCAYSLRSLARRNLPPSSGCP
ncbi:long-chain-alcohol O-fatty-acyltransferase 1 [Spatholobus suberectus]|nr:long-chain-alcohol O-fatty-acyltransferase 1 [Spatholobus suberectus]